MKITVLNGSPRPKGNTAALIDAFKEGAESKGHQVSVLQVGSMKIGGCKGCEYCHTKGNGACVQKDDMAEVYPALAAVSRFYAVMAPAAKKWALLLTSGSPGVYGAIEAQYKGILNFIQAEDLGIFAYDGKRVGTESAFAEVKAFGASL